MKLSPVTAACFAAALKGNYSALVLPSSADYDESVTPLNLNIPIAPAAVTYPSSADEVAGVVKCAAQSGLKVQAKGGGHSYGNYGWGGANGEVVVNLANLKSFCYDPQTQTARIGSGSNLGDVTTLLHNAGGRAVSHGACPDVGVGGHATIGGVGITSRMFGTTVDHVEAAEVVLANGSIVTASATENPDLLFAIKGAGGSFGIVTEFTFKTEPEPTQSVYFDYTFVSNDSTARAQILQDWQTFVANPNLPREFFPVVDVVTGTILIGGVYYGTLDQYNALNFESAFTVPPTLTNVTVVNDWLALSDIFSRQTASAEVPAYFYGKNIFVDPSSLILASSWDALFAYSDTTPSGAVQWLMEIQLLGGAIADVPANATAYAHRDALYFILFYALTNGTVTSTTYNFIDGQQKVITAAQPNASFPAYPGYVDPRLKNAQEQYWGSNLPRLESIKRKIDPHDVFHNPQSVPLRK